MRGLRGKAIIVTGAASGIGRAVAERLAEEGAAVGIFDLNAPGAEATAAAIRQSGLKAAPYAVDITDYAAIAKAVLPPERVESFERAMDDAETELPPLRAFVLPGGTPKAAALHLARTVCRRAERSVVRLAREEEAPAEILVYLNRLSDLLFTLARLANHREGRHDVTW